MTTESRRAKRSHVVMAARLRSRSGDVPVKVKNLSSTGACADCPDPLQPGDPVQLIRGDLVIPATIAWAVEGKIGIQFLEPVDERAFRAQGQASGNSVVMPLLKPAERLSRRLEQHWAGILNR